MKKKGVICGREFTAKTGIQLCCSPECSRVNERRRTVVRQRERRAEAHPVLRKTCPVCGAVFETRSRKKVCCSPECSRVRYRELSRQGNARRRARERAGDADPRGGYDADGRHRRFRERAMKAKPWKYEFADSPELLS